MTESIESKLPLTVSDMFSNTLRNGIFLKSTEYRGYECDVINTGLYFALTLLIKMRTYKRSAIVNHYVLLSINMI